MRAKYLALATVVALSLGASVFASTGTAGAACTSATNIEAIIDDSQSMEFSDSGLLRVAGMKLLIAKPGNAKKTLGAVEFGSSANTVFAPALIGTGAAAMNAALDANVLANNAGTDYDLGFTTAQAANPNATARIFLTDGAHLIGPYDNTHQGGPPTYVIGLFSFISATDEARLQQIASETGGKYVRVTDASGLQAAVNEVDAYLNCQAAPQKFTDTFTKVGQAKTHRVNISRTIKSVDLALTWSNPLDVFTLANIRLKTKNGNIASISKRRLRIKRVGGTTFLNVNVSRLKKGKLSFKLRLKTLASTTPTGVTLTTQATRNRR